MPSLVEACSRACEISNEGGHPRERGVHSGGTTRVCPVPAVEGGEVREGAASTQLTRSTDPAGPRAAAAIALTKEAGPFPRRRRRRGDVTYRAVYFWGGDASHSLPRRDDAWHSRRTHAERIFRRPRPRAALLCSLPSPPVRSRSRAPSPAVTRVAAPLGLSRALSRVRCSRVDTSITSRGHAPRVLACVCANARQLRRPRPDGDGSHSPSHVSHVIRTRPHDTSDVVPRTVRYVDRTRFTDRLKFKV